MPIILPSPERKKRLEGIQKYLAAHKEGGGIEPLAHAVALMLKEERFQNTIARSKSLRAPCTNEASLMKLAWAFLYDLLLADDYVAAALCLWDAETFSAEPNCVQLVWNALMTKRMICVIGGGALGKCLGPDVRVLMCDGTTRAAKDVVVGDKLMGDDGTERKVLLSNPGYGPMYRIVPERGEPWTCNGDHILTLQCGHTKLCGNGSPSTKRTKGSLIDVPLNEYLQWSKSKKNFYFLYHMGVELPEIELPYDPYIYGVWLGDGGWDTPAIHKPIGPITERWSQYFQSIGMRIHVGFEDTTCPMICARTIDGGPNPFTAFIRTSVKNKEKFIRDDYLRNSRENRMKLLAGLLDTDGYAFGSAFEITSKWEGLARQITWLARSLGFAATINSRIKTIKSIGFSATYWQVYISGAGISTIPTLQKKPPEPITPKNLVLTSFKVEPIGDGPFNGFVIDGNHRFLLGDFTVTHNTYSTCAYFLLAWITDPEWCKIEIASASAKHLQKNAFADIVRLHSGASMTLPGKIDTESIALDKKRGNGIFTLVIPGGPESKATLKGSHTKARPMHPKFGRRSRVFCLIDESQEVAPNIFGQIKNRFSSIDDDDVDHQKFVLTANPKSMFSEFGLCAKPIKGWESIKREDTTWESERGWTVVSLDATQHENVLQKRIVYPGFVTTAGIQSRLKDCNGNWEDPMMWTYIFGKFPPLGTANTVIKQQYLTAAEKEWLFTGQTSAKAGADVAFTGDRPALACARVGTAIGWIDYAGERHMLDEPKVAIQLDAVATLIKTPDSQILADDYMERVKPLGVEPAGFGIDRTGAGRGTHDIIRHQWAQKIGVYQADGVALAPIHGIEYASSPSEVKVAAEDTATPKEMYDIMASALWFEAARLFELGIIGIGKGVDIKVMAELSARQGGMQPGKGKKLCVESKAVFKKRTGMDSPDLADAALICIHVARITTPALIPKAKDTKPAPPAEQVTPWAGFNQSFGAVDFGESFALPEQMDVLKD